MFVQIIIHLSSLQPSCVFLLSGVQGTPSRTMVPALHIPLLPTGDACAGVYHTSAGVERELLIDTPSYICLASSSLFPCISPLSSTPPLLYISCDIVNTNV